MKKVLTLCLSAIFAILMASCGMGGLKGTSWAYSMEEEDMYSINLTLNFVSDDEVQLDSQMNLFGEEGSESQVATYTYNSKDKTGTIEIEGESTEFTVDGDVLTIEEDGITMEFKKQ